MKKLVFVLLLLAFSMPAVASDGRLTVDRYLDWEDVANPQLSPDGKQIVYERRWVDAVNDKWETSLWIINADGSKNRFLVDGSSPRWSPDGTRIAFTAKGEPDGTQIFVRWMDAEGAVSQVSRLTARVPLISPGPPTETSIAFQMVVPPKATAAGRSTCRQSPRAPTGPSPRPSSSGSTTGAIGSATGRRDSVTSSSIPADGGTPRPGDRRGLASRFLPLDAGRQVPSFFSP